MSKGYEVAFSDDGSRLVALGKNVAIADVPGRKRIASVHPLSHPSHVAFAPTGQRFGVKSTSGRIVLLDSDSGSVVLDYQNEHEGEGSGLVFSPAGDRLLEGSWQGVLRERRTDIVERATEARFEDCMVEEVSTTRDRSLVLVRIFRRRKTRQGPEGCQLRLWRWGTGFVADLPCSLDLVHRATISPDGELVAVAGSSRKRNSWLTQVLDRRGDIKSEAECEFGGTGFNIQWSPDSTMLACVQKSGFAIRDVASLQAMHLEATEFPSMAAFSPDGTQIAYGSWKQTLLLPTPPRAEPVGPRRVVD